LDALAAARQEIRMVVGVLPVGQAPLAKVADTLGCAGFALGVAEGWEEKARQDRNDGDDDEQLDEGKGCA
jgi:hypothetical protein